VPRPALSITRPAIRAGLLLFSLIFCFSGCVKRARHVATYEYANEQQTTTAAPKLNLNTASANELETLPGMGGVSPSESSSIATNSGRFGVQNI
jgi:hypothetical protein